jgi:hypothetical protein
MSDGASDDQRSAEAGSFEEHDASQTMLPYGNGGVPFYVAVIWVGFIIAYVTGVVALVLPDLRAWMAN